MSRLLVWVILGILCLFVLVYSYRHYRSSTTVSEPFSETLSGTLRPCAVYYTSNVDICDRPSYNSDMGSLSNVVNLDAINYYTIGSNEINDQIIRLEADTARDTLKNNALANLRRAMADIEKLPFKNTCKLEMTSLQEATQHPYKINTDFEGTARRGNPIHWSYCYYPTSADTTLGATNRIPPSVRANSTFTRVFQDTQMDYQSASAGTLHRYDMKSMFNDDLINLHCLLYSTNIEAGGSISAFQNTKFMECILDGSDVRSATAKTLRILKMRPVVIYNGTLILEPLPAEIKKAYLRFIDIVRTQDAFIHRQKSYPLSVYKLLFHLCSASPSAIPGSTGMTNLVYDKYIQLAIPKPVRGSDTQLLKFKTAYNTIPSLQIYNFYNQPPAGDISDMVFNIGELDTRI